MASPVETDNSLVNKHVTESLFCVDVRRELRKQPGASRVFKLERDKMKPSKSDQGERKQNTGIPEARWVKARAFTPTGRQSKMEGERPLPKPGIGARMELGREEHGPVKLENKDTRMSRLGGGVVWVTGSVNQEVHPRQGDKAWPRGFGG